MSQHVGVRQRVNGRDVVRLSVVVGSSRCYDSVKGGKPVEKRCAP